MKRYTYIIITILIGCLLSLPTKLADGIRSFSAAAFAPYWSFSPNPSVETKKEIESMRLEIHNLHSQLELMKAQVDLEKLVAEEAELLKHFVRDEGFAKRRKTEIFRLIDLYTPSLMGQVIFRETASWSSSFWINLGEKTNQSLGKTVIAKNSPVVMGTTVLGLVEYVGENRSRVRLVTDASIVPSVRVLRGNEQQFIKVQQAKKLLEMVDEGQLKKELTQFIQNFRFNGENFYLAKGELRGIRAPFFRSRHAVLQGVGFNYDFEDEEGPGRGLREAETPLVKKGDILVTTGLDGVFPAGLKVAEVSKVYPLREGATSYEIDAVSLIENFDTLSFVAVLPPQNH